MLSFIQNYLKGSIDLWNSYVAFPPYKTSFYLFFPCGVDHQFEGLNVMFQKPLFLYCCSDMVTYVSKNLLPQMHEVGLSVRFDGS